MHALRDTLTTVRRFPGFGLGLVVTLLAATFNGAMVLLMALRLDSLLPGAFAQMGHFTEPHHRIHDLTFALLFLPALVGVLAQVRRPRRNVAGMLTALVPSIALLLTLLLTVGVSGDLRTLQPPWLMVMAGALIALVLHPAGREVFRVAPRSRVERRLVALTVTAAVPLLPLAVRNIGLQATVADDHAAAGHYGFMAAFALAVVGVALLASLQPVGWRVTAWAAGLLPALLGITSLVYPLASSRLGAPGAVAAIGWGVVFVATAEHARREQHAAEVAATPAERERAPTR
jgi:putative effector of murein hydrolase LrgA (UPF0299 family)